MSRHGVASWACGGESSASMPLSSSDGEEARSLRGVFAVFLFVVFLEPGHVALGERGVVPEPAFELGRSWWTSSPGRQRPPGG